MARQLGFLPPANPKPPLVILSTEEATELRHITDLYDYDDSYGDEMMIVLVRVAQWVALARGFLAVHLFCDMARLMSRRWNPANTLLAWKCQLTP